MIYCAKKVILIFSPYAQVIIRCHSGNWSTIWFLCSFLWNREYYLHRCEVILHEQRVESCAGLVNLRGLWACICGRLGEPTELHVQIRCGRRLNC